MLHVSSDDTLERWTIDAPSRGNGLGMSLASAFLKATENLDQRSTPLLITAKPIEKPNGTIWVAGGDLVELAALKSKPEGRIYAQAMSQAFLQLHESNRIVITAVDGAAIGGGAELALVGDLRLATAASTVEFKQLKVGLATGYGSARRLVDLIGLGRSERLLYFCEKLTAAEAESLGLIHKTLKDSLALDNEITNLVKHLNGLAPEALTAQKKMLRAASGCGSDDARRIELDLFTSIWMNPHHASFLKKFSDKS